VASEPIDLLHLAVFHDIGEANREIRERSQAIMAETALLLAETARLLTENFPILLGGDVLGVMEFFSFTI
jgi:hypothetical protein